MTHRRKPIGQLDLEAAMESRLVRERLEAVAGELGGAAFFLMVSGFMLWLTAAAVDMSDWVGAAFAFAMALFAVYRGLELVDWSACVVFDRHQCKDCEQVEERYSAGSDGEVPV